MLLRFIRKKKLSRIKFIPLILLLIASGSLLKAQQAPEVAIIVGDNFDIRNISKLYFGDPDLWPFILKHNNKPALNALKQGEQIKIPVKKVNSMQEAIKKAESGYRDAVNLGARVLANDLLDEAGAYFSKALNYKKNLDSENAESSALESVKLYDKAYRKTKEIREKTIDAIISFKKGTVQKMYSNNLNWQNAEIYENLRENDWARTLALSMANITFQDLSQIKLNENSQAMIQQSRFDPIENKSDTKVKIEKGDAYAMLQSSPKKNFKLDIKGIKTTINSKYFWVEKNNSTAKVANYNGEIKIAVKDSSVTVKKNQGSVIPEGGYPGKPKNLLSSPAIIYPEDLATISKPEISFKWNKVRSADSYWLIVASDSRFKNLYGVYKNIKEDSFNFKGFQPGVYYWYVCSVDSSGLPGPYSTARGFVYSENKNKPFLSLESIPENLFVKENKITIEGKTDSDSKITVNDSPDVALKDGKFSYTLPLKEGRNKLIVKGINPAGMQTVIERNIFLESNPEVRIEDVNYGLLKDNMEISVTGQTLNLSFIIRPYASLEVRSSDLGYSRTVYCDSLGKSSISIPVKKERANLLLYAETPAGYVKSINIKAVQTVKSLNIILVSPPVSGTNKDTVEFKGSAKGAVSVLVNGSNADLSREGLFRHKVKLSGHENRVIIKATDENGNTGVLEKKIVFDNSPPKFITKEISWNNQEKTSVKVTVKAEDLTELKKTCEVELVSEGAARKEILIYNEKSGVYEGVFPVSGRKIPAIKSIALGDYLMNNKTYYFSGN